MLLILLGSCTFLREIRYNFPGESDVKKFPYRTIKAAPDSTVFTFYRSVDTPGFVYDVVLQNRPKDSKAVHLDEFVKLHRTISFLIIRNDSILYQYYAPDYSAESRVTSFSVAKAYITMLVGIAIEEGCIKSESEPITNYITEWKDQSGYNKITIQHLLNHTSGLKFIKYLADPVSNQAQFYYGKQLRKYTLSRPIQEPPGLHFSYSSENTMLLAMILERSTGKTVSEYLQQKIWSKIGTESTAVWSTDRDDDHAIEKSFCCLNARTQDFAKFARLLLNKGNWKGVQLIPEHWIDEATERKNKEGSGITYGYNLGLGPALYKSFFAIGLYGQFLYVYPKKNIIIVRFGKPDIAYNPNYWKEVMLQLIDQL